jgi:hypothetical protein
VKDSRETIPIPEDNHSLGCAACRFVKTGQILPVRILLRFPRIKTLFSQGIFCRAVGTNLALINPDGGGPP